MRTVHATYVNGVFRPHEQPDLPERSEVEFEPRPVTVAPALPLLRRVYEVLAERFASGQTDVAARHDEHQP